MTAALSAKTMCNSPFVIVFLYFYSQSMFLLNANHMAA